MTAEDKETMSQTKKNKDIGRFVFVIPIYYCVSRKDTTFGI